MVIRATIKSLLPLRIKKTPLLTCAYELFAFKRMALGLCNSLGTFQCCMKSIFFDMVEDTIEVFMDDFSVVGDSFDRC